MNVSKEDEGYSASTSVGNIHIHTEGDTHEELKNNILDAVNISFADKDLVYTAGEIILKPDLRSFFEFYKVLNVKALSERMGMNQSLLAQYIRGIKKPSAAQERRILREVHRLGNELASIRSFMHDRSTKIEGLKEIGP